MGGSTVHYISDSEPNLEPRLSPASQLQVASLQAARDVSVVVVPHWRWQWGASVEDRGTALVQLLLDDNRPTLDAGVSIEHRPSQIGGQITQLSCKSSRQSLDRISEY